MDQANEKEIDLRQLLNVLLKRWWIILIVAVLAAVLLFAYSVLFVTPQYQSSVLMYVNNSSISVGSLSVNAADLTASRNLIPTYRVFLKSRLTLEEVCNIVNADPEIKTTYSYGKLYSMVDASSENNTEVLRVKVVGTDPKDTQIIANCILTVLPQKISGIIEGTSVATVDVAQVGTRVSPSYSKYAIIGFLVGLVVSAGFFIVRDVFVNDAIDSETWLKDTYKEDIPLLSVIPDAEEDRSRYSKYGKYGKYGDYYSRYGYYGYGEHTEGGDKQ